jgi:DNA repair exonuclease SbcCD ATPase subunit
MADKDIEKIRDDITALQTQAAKADVVVERLDYTLDKIADLSTQIQQMLVVHEHRFESSEQQHETLSRQMDQRAETADKEMNILHRRISSLQEQLDLRLRKIEIWQWVIVGGASAAGFFISRLFGVDFFK